MNIVISTIFMIFLVSFSMGDLHEHPPVPRRPKIKLIEFIINLKPKPKGKESDSLKVKDGRPIHIQPKDKHDESG